jgi:hypothetical protein
MKHFYKTKVGFVISPVSLEKRRARITRFKNKRVQQKLNPCKYTYMSRRREVNKKLRIKGRFINYKECYEILGLDPNQPKDDEEL